LPYQLGLVFAAIAGISVGAVARRTLARQP
jgi:hypothetical protein